MVPMYDKGQIPLTQQTDTSMYVCIYVCMYICMYVCIRIRKHELDE